MRITRRAMLAASAAFAGLISGCQAPQADAKTMTDRTPRHFNDSGELTSDVNNPLVKTDTISNKDWVGGGESSVSLSPQVDLAETGNNFTNVIYPITDDHIVITWKEGDGHVSGGIIKKRVTKDGGKTWSDPETVYDSQYSDRGLGGGLAPDGSLVLFFYRFEDDTGDTVDAGYIRSTDDGDTWSSYTTIDNRGWSAPRPYAGFAVNGSELIKPVYAINNNDGEIWVLSSTDNGATWSYKSTVESWSGGNPNNEFSIAHIGNGNIVGLARKQTDTGFQQYSSTDGGDTWTNEGTAYIATNSQDVSPVVYYDSATNTIRTICASRRGWYRYRGVPANWMSFAIADASAIQGSPSEWRDYIWSITNCNHDQGITGYPFVADTGERRLIGYSPERSGNGAEAGAVALSVIDEESVIRLSQARLALHYNIRVGRLLPTKQEIVGKIPRLMLEASSTTKVDTTSPATSWTQFDCNREIPKSASTVYLEVAFSGDGTTDAQATVEVGSVQFDNMPNDQDSMPADSGGTATTVLEAEVQNGVSTYQTTNVGSITISVAGFVP